MTTVRVCLTQTTVLSFCDRRTTNVWRSDVELSRFLPGRPEQPFHSYGLLPTKTVLPLFRSAALSIRRRTSWSGGGSIDSGRAISFVEFSLWSNLCSRSSWSRSIRPARSDQICQTFHSSLGFALMLLFDLTLPYAIDELRPSHLQVLTSFSVSASSLR